MKLKEKLEKVVSLKSKEELEKAFNELAFQLLNGYVIEKTIGKNTQTYEFAEIEFYLRSGAFNDPCVHKYAQSEAGCFRVHYSGVDLTFGSSILESDLNKISAKMPLTEDQYYGGILIRVLKKGSEYICGPLRVQTELFSGLSIENENLSIKLKEKESIPQKQLAWTTRQGVNEDSTLCYKDVCSTDAKLCYHDPILFRYDSILCCYDKEIEKSDNTKGYGDAKKRFINNERNSCEIIAKSYLK